jgi:hypothetical protein
VITDVFFADSKNDQTLRFAAQKIADVALQQPHHIPSVLRQVRYTAALCVPLLHRLSLCATARMSSQVHQKLYSREWKARVYAGDVLADLAHRVEHCAVERLGGLPAEPVRHDRSNALVNFSLNSVLQSGATNLVAGNQVRHTFAGS